MILYKNNLPFFKYNFNLSAGFITLITLSLLRYNKKHAYDDRIEIHFNYIKNFNPDDGGQGFLFTTKFKTIKYVILNFPNIQTIEIFVKVYF